MDNYRLLPALLFVAVLAAPAHGAIDDARAKGLKWLVQAQKGDGSFAGTQGLELQSTAAAVEAMIAGGMTKSPQYARALSWLANAPGGSLDARAWQTMALASAGRDVSAIAGGIRDERDLIATMNGGLYNNIAVWGPFQNYAASVVDTALGYGALRSAGLIYPNDTAEFTNTVECRLLPAQLTAAPWAGSWPHALPQSNQPPASGSLLSTAALLFELKKSRQGNRLSTSNYFCGNPPSAVDTALTNAKLWVIAQANSDGGLAERNPQNGALEASNPVATALAVRALALFAAEGDPAANSAVSNARDWLVGQQGVDGSWRRDPFVTARVVAAFPAATGAQLTDADNDGIPDVVEQQLGTQVAQADGQGVLTTSARAALGVTASAFAVGGTVGQAFTYTLTASGGTGPYGFVLKNGVLPAGLSLAQNGQIAGTPTGSGSYAFDYEVSDALGAKVLVIGRIDVGDGVVSGTSGEGDVPIPLWALVALGAALLPTMRRKAV